MSTREKIIVGLMVVAVIYGVYMVFFAGSQDGIALKSGADKDLEALNMFITQVAAKTKSSLSNKQAYILQKAQSEWKQDPLMHIQPQLSKEEEEERQPLVLNSEFLYTGFLQMGDKRLAIINGLEYEIGDRLEPGGFIVRNIYSHMVVIGSPVKKNKTVNLPMEEIE